MGSKISKKLLDHLHEANQRFGDARRKREAAVDEPVMESTHLDQANEQLLSAEKDLEEVDAQIKSALHPDDLPQGGGKDGAGNQGNGAADG